MQPPTLRQDFAVTSGKNQSLGQDGRWVWPGRAIVRDVCVPLWDFQTMKTKILILWKTPEPNATGWGTLALCCPSSPSLLFTPSFLEGGAHTAGSKVSARLLAGRVT